MLRQSSPRIATLVVGIVSLGLGGCGCRGNAPAPTDPTSRPLVDLEVTCPALDDNGRLPISHTKHDVDHSPPLAWSGAPNNTQSFAIVCEDRAGMGGAWVHWIVFNIPARMTALKANQPKTAVILRAAKQGTNSYGELGYGGPQISDGKVHHYDFTVYALDCLLDLEAGASRSELERAMRGHIVGRGQVTATFRY